MVECHLAIALMKKCWDSIEENLVVTAGSPKMAALARTISSTGLGCSSSFDRQLAHAGSGPLRSTSQDVCPSIEAVDYCSQLHLIAVVLAGTFLQSHRYWEGLLPGAHVPGAGHQYPTCLENRYPQFQEGTLVKTEID